MGLIVANVRRNAPARPSRTTASVSSSPSRRLEAASALIRSGQRAVASRDALAASKPAWWYASDRRRSNSAWCFSGTWALTLRFLWTWQRWITAFRPQTRFAAA
jgi:hypothetical protein